MNCNISILQTFDLETRGEYVCKVRKGDIYTGTVQSNRQVLFHVTDGGGTIHPVTMLPDDVRIGVAMFNTQTNG